MTERALREAMFIDDGRGGRLFALHTMPRGRIRGAILYVHPFAEEMNRSRRMVALATRAFANDGWAVLQVDLAGCGDSSGDSSDATWELWLSNLDVAMEWLQGRHAVPVAVWGLRAGCLLLSDWLAQRSIDFPVLYWQPVSSGRQHMSHFLLLKVAGDLPDSKDAKSILQGMRSRLEMGGSVDVAGYSVDSALVRGLEQTVLDFPSGYRGPVSVLEVTSSGRDELTPILASFVGRWQQQGLAIETGVLEGPAFWLTQEVTTAPELVGRSLQVLERLAA